MKPEIIDATLQQKDHVTNDFKVEWDAYRFHLNGKMFAMRCFNKQNEMILTLKLPPQEGAYYRENYADWITLGYYMNKVHWISIRYDLAEEELLLELMEKAYLWACQSLPRKIQKEWDLL